MNTDHYNNDSENSTVQNTTDTEYAAPLVHNPFKTTYIMPNQFASALNRGYNFQSSSAMHLKPKLERSKRYHKKFTKSIYQPRQASHSSSIRLPSIAQSIYDIDQPFPFMSKHPLTQQANQLPSIDTIAYSPQLAYQSPSDSSSRLSPHNISEYQASNPPYQLPPRRLSYQSASSHLPYHPSPEQFSTQLSPFSSTIPTSTESSPYHSNRESPYQLSQYNPYQSSRVSSIPGVQESPRATAKQEFKRPSSRSPSPPSSNFIHLTVDTLEKDEFVPTKARKNLSKQHYNLLIDWLKEHLDHPYPSHAEKSELQKSTGLTSYQLSNFFINARRRKLPLLKKQSKKYGYQSPEDQQKLS